MPIFEYVCKSCGKKFEAILFGDAKPECPACKGSELEQQLSKFAVGAERSSAPAPMSPCGMGGGCGGGKCPMA